MVPSDFIVAAAVQLQLRARPLAAPRKALTSSIRVEAAVVQLQLCTRHWRPPGGAKEGADLVQQALSRVVAAAVPL